LADAQNCKMRKGKKKVEATVGTQPQGLSARNGKKIWDIQKEGEKRLYKEVEGGEAIKPSNDREKGGGKVTGIAL